jgi:2-oxoglutarate ferredoxin oxidoreductase subunit gamma
MTYDVFMTGFGGQGILIIGNLLAYAGILEGKHVSYFPSYGVEKRGGAANCTVVVSDEEVGSPVIGAPSAGIILNQASFDRHIHRFKPGAFCLLNSSLIEMGENCRDDLEILPLPLNEMALELGDARLLNMIAIGVYGARCRPVRLESLKSALTEVLPERNHRFIPLNIEAIDLGAAAVKAKTVVS